MDNRYKFFLLAAENGSMRKAAEIAYISPQGISSAIKSLEKEYGVPLFLRSPSLKLTAQGEMLLETIRKIETIEKNLTALFDSEGRNFSGHISLGILESRYELFIPSIVYEFIRKYENVELEVKSDYSRTLEIDVLNNKLDMIIAPGSISSPELECIHLIDEDFVLLISGAMLKKYGIVKTESDLKKLQKGIILKDFVNVPLIRYPQYTRFFLAINNYEETEHISFKTAFVSNHLLSYSRFVQKNVGMAIATSTFLPRIAEQNNGCEEEEYVHALPILDLKCNRELNLYYKRDRFLTKCHYDLIDIIKNSVSSSGQQALHFL